MPQMGESIAEGTIVRWIKKVGDSVDRDEPLFEISTDKVDAEIPSPAAGVLTAIAVKEGETVPVNQRRRDDWRRRRDRCDCECTVPRVQQVRPVQRCRRVRRVTPRRPTARRQDCRRTCFTLNDECAPAARCTRCTRCTCRHPRHLSAASDERQKSSPLVRKIAQEHNVDISRIPGSGIGGRVTKQDILGFIERRRREQRRAPASEPAHAPAPVDAAALAIRSSRCR